jgi:hypothetical protein
VRQKNQKRDSERLQITTPHEKFYRVSFRIKKGVQLSKKMHDQGQLRVLKSRIGSKKKRQCIYKKEVTYIFIQNKGDDFSIFVHVLEDKQLLAACQTSITPIANHCELFLETV